MGFVIARRVADLLEQCQDPDSPEANVPAVIGKVLDRQDADIIVRA